MTGPRAVPLFWREAKAAGMGPVCAVDFEGSDRTGVVEFGTVLIGPEGILDAATSLCRPRSAVSGRETETHGLDDESLAGTEPFAAHWERFRDLRRTGPLLAHAAAVEDRFLRRQWPTPGEAPDWSQAPATGIGWGPWLDSCALVRSIAPGGSAALRPVVEAWGLAPELEALAERFCPAARRRWHAALYDSLASALIFLRILEERAGWPLRRFFRESAGDRAEGEQTVLL